MAQPALRRRSDGASAGFSQPPSAGLRLTPGATIWSMRSSRSAPYHRVRVEPEALGDLAGTEQPLLIVRKMGTQPLGALARELRPLVKLLDQQRCQRRAGVRRLRSTR